VTNGVQAEGGASPFYPIIEKMVVDEITRLDKQQITPWAFFNSGHPVRYKDFYGAEKTVGGAILFDGSVRIVFWNGYVQPFLEALAVKAIEETVRRCKENDYPRRIPLEQTAGLLKGYNRKTFARMVDIDRRLRGKGYPDSVQPYKAAGEINLMDAFVERHIAGELKLIQAQPLAQLPAAPQTTPPAPSVPKGWARVEIWHKEHALAAKILWAAFAAISAVIAKSFL